MVGIDGTLAGTVRVGFPEADALSLQRWVGERAASLLPLLTDSIRERCEPFTTLLVFLTGSATHGELAGVVTPDGRQRYLSDIDVGVLTERRMPDADQERTAFAVASMATDAPEPRLGFYCMADIEHQDPTLGLVEGVRCGIVLDGDPAHLLRFRVPAPEAIPAAEARRLLANRVLGFLASGQSADAPLGRAYAACKLYSDLAAVSLLARGGYRGGGFRDRARAVRELGHLEAPLQLRVDAWTDWRIAPRWDATPAGMAVDDARMPAHLSTLGRETTREGLRICTGGDSIDRFVGGVLPGPRARARSWRRWIGGRPDTLLRLRPADLLRSPRGLLWGAAIACALQDEAKAAMWLQRLGSAPAREDVSSAERIGTIGHVMETKGID